MSVFSGWGAQISDSQIHLCSLEIVKLDADLMRVPNCLKAIVSAQIHLFNVHGIFVFFPLLCASTWQVWMERLLLVHWPFQSPSEGIISLAMAKLQPGIYPNWWAIWVCLRCCFNTCCSPLRQITMKSPFGYCLLDPIILSKCKVAFFSQRCVFYPK